MSQKTRQVLRTVLHFGKHHPLITGTIAYACNAHTSHIYTYMYMCVCVYMCVRVRNKVTQLWGYACVSPSFPTYHNNVLYTKIHVMSGANRLNLNPKSNVTIYGVELYIF